MILEGIVTSRDADGTLNIAPMGPIVAPEMTSLVLRPFLSSQTYRNLKVHPQGVFHVVDDVLLLAQAALNRLPAEVATSPAVTIAGRVLENCCRWYEFEITACDDSQARARLETRIVHTGCRRDVFGFNRAKHAVLEATILATRLHLMPRDVVFAELQRLEPLVEKTAGDQERQAWNLVRSVISSQFDGCRLLTPGAE